MTATTTHWTPEGFHTLTPYLHPAADAKLADFLKAAFGATENFRVPRPDGTIMHAQLRIGDSIVELGEVPADYASPKATSFRLFVEDVDAIYGRSIDAGAESLHPPVDQSYGYREAGIKDPAGNYWWVSRALKGGYKAPESQDVEISLLLRGADSFIRFVKDAFGAEELERHASPDGAVRYASMRLGDSVFSLGEAHDRWQPMPGGIHHYVPDVDETYRRALATGAKPHTPPANTPYGDRAACVIDPQGNWWYLATHIGAGGQ